MHTLTLAHSADADDVFMWWPITGQIDPAQPSRVLRKPALDTGRFAFTAVPEDIQVLNRRAIERADLDITAISFATLPLVAQRYRPTVCGSSMGVGWGPKLVAKADRADLQLESLPASRPTIAVPGKQTSAFMVLSSMLPPGSFQPIEKPFDRIIDTVASGEADLGVLIHESQLTFERAGLRLLTDLGVWFNRTHGLPMPLGSNVVRSDLDDRFGPGSLREVTRLLSTSIGYALEHRRESLDYARSFSPLKADDELNRYIDFYVNALTVDCRPDGARAVELLLSNGAKQGLLPSIGPVQWLTPD